MNKNSIILTIISVVAIFGFLLVVYQATNKPAEVDSTVYEQVKKLNDTDHIKWSSAKKHILVEYSDLQCPACKTYHDFIKQEIEASGSGKPEVVKNITFVYRHFPLTQIHKNAQDAAYAAEAAGKQGKFFEMSDAMFNTQTEWAEKSQVRDYFVELAKKLKLDTEQFKKDMDSKEVKDKVQNDVTSGGQANVNATPTFYLDGKKVDNVRSFDEFVQLLADTAKK